MPAVTRLGDNCTGHGCFPPRPSAASSGNVFANSKGVVRVGDAYAAHCCGPSCHGGSLASGSGSVFVNSKPTGRIGDNVDCGSAVAEGSGNVFAGG